MQNASLFDPENLGGVLGAKGYAFQNSYVLNRLPDWLADPTFQGLQVEGFQDVEVFFEASDGRVREAIQIKDHVVTPAEVRSVVANLYALEQKALQLTDPICYRCHVLACVGLPSQFRRLKDLLDICRSRSAYTPEERAASVQDLAALSAQLKLEVPVEFILEKLALDVVQFDLTDIELLSKLFRLKLYDAASLRVPLLAGERVFHRIAGRFAGLWSGKRWPFIPRADFDSIVQMEVAAVTPYLVTLERVISSRLDDLATVAAAYLRVPVTIPYTDSDRMPLQSAAVSALCEALCESRPAILETLPGPHLLSVYQFTVFRRSLLDNAALIMNVLADCGVPSCDGDPCFIEHVDRLSVALQEQWRTRSWVPVSIEDMRRIYQRILTRTLALFRKRAAEYERQPTQSGGDFLDIEEHLLYGLGYLEQLLHDQHTRLLKDRQDQQQLLKQIADEVSAFRVLTDQWIGEVLQAEQNVRFYHGFRATWSDLGRGLDIIRDQFASIFQLALQLAGQRVLLAIIAEMGAGKTTLLKRLALELHLAGNVVLYYKEGMNIGPADQIRAVANTLAGQPQKLFLCIDDAARVAGLQQFVDQLAQYGLKATIIMASRTGEWREANLAFTANLDDDPFEIDLAPRLSAGEGSALAAKLLAHGQLRKPVKLEEDNFLVTMMQATGGHGFQEIIRIRVNGLRQRNQILAKAYEYTCLLSQFGLSMPLSLLQALLPGHDLHTEVLTQPLFDEVFEYSEESYDSDTAITAGHEEIARAVIRLEYGQDAKGRARLRETYDKLVKAVHAPLGILCADLLTKVAKSDKTLAAEILARRQDKLANLRAGSSPSELSQTWAKLYAAAGDYEAAEECHKTALRVGDSSFLLASYAWFLHSRLRFHEARRILEYAVAKDPRDVGARIELARFLHSILLYDEAAQHLDAANEMDSAGSHFQLMMPIYFPVLMYLQRYEEAERVAQRGLDLEPSRRRIWFVSLFRALLGQRAYQRARTAMIQGMETDVEIAAALRRLFANPLLDVPVLPAEVEEDYVRLLSSYMPSRQPLPGTPSSRSREVEDEEISPAMFPTTRVNRLSIGATHLTSIAVSANPQSAPFSADAIRKTINNLRSNGQAERIPAFLEGLIEAQPHIIEPYLACAEYCIMEGRDTDAEAYLLGAVSHRNPTDFSPQLRYACYLVGTGRVSEARNYFGHASSISVLAARRWARAVPDYVVALIDSGQVEQALDTLNQSTCILPWERAQPLVDTLLTERRFADLERLCYSQSRVGNSQEDKDAYGCLMLLAASRQGRRIKYSKTALRACAPYRARIAAALATYEFRQRSLTAAEPLIHSAVDLAPEHPDVQMALAEFLMLQRKYDAAAVQIEKALEMDPELSIAYALRGQVLTWLGRTAEAYVAFERGVTAEHYWADASTKYSFFLAHEADLLDGVHAGAREHLLGLSVQHGETAYQREPTNSYVGNNYALALLKSGRLDEAGAVVDRLLEINPEDVFVVQRAAEIRDASGDPDGALSLYRKAVAVAPSEMAWRVKRRLARALLSRGKIEEAEALSDLGWMPQKARLAAVSMDTAEWSRIRGDWKQAQEHYQMLMERWPIFGPARFALAALLFEQGQVRQAVITYITWALQCSQMRQLIGAIRAGYLAFKRGVICSEPEVQRALVWCGLLAADAAIHSPHIGAASTGILMEVADSLAANSMLLQSLLSEISDTMAGNTVDNPGSIVHLLAQIAPETIVSSLRAHLNELENYSEQRAKIVSLIEKLRTNCYDRRYATIQTLLAFGPDLLLPEVLRYLGDDDLRIRSSLADLLGYLDHAECVPALLRLLHDPTMQVRKKALVAASRHNDPSLHRAIEDITADPIPSVRALAAELLARRNSD